MTGRKVTVLGANVDLGQSRRGVDMGPSAIRYAGLEARVCSRGLGDDDLGNVESAVFEAAPVGDPSARFLAQIMATSERIADSVAETVDGGNFPLVLGGDHSIGIGMLGGLARA